MYSLSWLVVVLYGLLVLFTTVQAPLWANERTSDGHMWSNDDPTGLRYACGPISLLAACRAVGITVELDQILKISEFEPGKGVAIDRLCRAAALIHEESATCSRVSPSQLTSFLKGAGAAVLFVRRGKSDVNHAIAAISVRTVGGTTWVGIVDYPRQTTEVSLTDLSTSWDGDAILLVDRNRQPRLDSLETALWFIFPFYTFVSLVGYGVNTLRLLFIKPMVPLLLLVSSLLGCNSKTTENTELGQESRELAVGHLEVDLGVVEPGVEYVQEIVVQNRRSRPLHAKDVKTSCGCLKLFENLPSILPGDTVKWKVRLKPEGAPGPLSSFVTISSASTSESGHWTTSVLVTGCKAGVWVSPSALLVQHDRQSPVALCAAGCRLKDVTTRSTEGLKVTLVPTGAARVRLAGLTPEMIEDCGIECQSFDVTSTDMSAVTRSAAVILEFHDDANTRKSVRIPVTCR